MKTKKTSICQELFVWAIPYPESYLEENHESEKFYYEIRTTGCWADGAVNVMTIPFSAEIPEGIDLTEKAIKTLEDAKLNIMADYTKRISEIDNLINSLTFIEHINE